MIKILKRVQGSNWWSVIEDFKSDYLEECKKGRFTQNNTEIFKLELEEKGFVKLIWADYKIFRKDYYGRY